jgi:hypothetical protein|tara:strand:- start:737 stop:976 length:240 start_codon:yes stop_codon:yes gene_type:complete
LNEEINNNKNRYIRGMKINHPFLWMGLFLNAEKINNTKTTKENPPVSHSPAKPALNQGIEISRIAIIFSESDKFTKNSF